MIDETKPILFLFLAGAVDILVTQIVIFMGWGIEMTEYYNWISPDWLMCLYMIVVNLVFCLALLYFYHHLSRNNTHIFIHCSLISMGVFLYGAGIARLLFGAGTGIAIIASVVLI